MHNNATLYTKFKFYFCRINQYTKKSVISTVVLHILLLFLNLGQLFPLQQVRILLSEHHKISD